MESEEDMQRRVLSNFSLEYIFIRSLNSGYEPPLVADGFTRFANPLNWPPVSDQPIAEPLYLAIPEYLQSIETLEFLGFRRAIAEHILADFTSPDRKDATSPSSLVDLAKKYITTAAEQNSRREAKPMETDAIKCINLVQDFMGIDFDGPALDLIDEPERPLSLSMVTEWVISTTERRYEFLCNLDSVIRNVEILSRGLEEEEEKREDDELSSVDAAAEAKRKAKNRKKAQAKKASKQKKKSLGERQAEGDHEGESKDLLGQSLFAISTEQEGGVQASTDAKEGRTSPIFE